MLDMIRAIAFSTLLRSALVGSIMLFLAMPLAQAGPPFMTDDPEPVEYGHSEAYVFSTMDKAPDGKTLTLPAFEFNTAPAPDVQLHLMVPFLDLRPNDGSHAHGLGDVEIGVKYRFVHETDSLPQIGIFPELELPTGDQSTGLGNGRTWVLLPLWLQKSWGPWTTYGGGGRAFNSAPGMKDYNYGGWLVQRSITDNLTLGGEIFHQGATSDEGRPSTFFNVGGSYNGIAACGGCSLLFRVGKTLAGEVHREAYLGLYWTWGRDEKK